MFGISIIKTKELQRLRHIDEAFVSIIQSKDRLIDSLNLKIEQLKMSIKQIKN